MNEIKALFRFQKSDSGVYLGLAIVLGIALTVFSLHTNASAKHWDIQMGYWWILGVGLTALGAFFYSAKDLWTAQRQNLPSKISLGLLGVFIIVITLFITQNITKQHRVLSDENSWESMGLEMLYNQKGSVCNQGYWDKDNSFHCVESVNNFKGKTLSLLYSFVYLMAPPTRDTALQVNLPLFLASLVFFFFALHRFTQSSWIALAATFFLGSMPIYMMQSQAASTEVLYVFLLTFLLWIYAMVPADQVRWKHLVLIAMVLGLFSGTRQETLFCFIPFALYYHRFLRQKPWHLAVFVGLIILASWPAVNSMAAYRGYDFQGGTHAAHSLSNFWFNIQTNIGTMMQPGYTKQRLLENPFYALYSALWLFGTLWLLIRTIQGKNLWGSLLMLLFHVQSFVILVNVSGTFEIDINQRYVLIALPSFAWIMAYGLYDFLHSVPSEQNPIRRWAAPFTLIIATLAAGILTYQHRESFQANILYRKNKLLAEEMYLNTELKKLPPHSILIYSRPWQMLCSGFNAFSERSFQNWSDEEYARWKQFSNNNIYLVRGQDGYGTVDKNSRVVGFKTTSAISTILDEFEHETLWSNAKNFGYPLSLIQLKSKKGRSPWAENFSMQLSAQKLTLQDTLTIQITRSFPEILSYDVWVDSQKKLSATFQKKTESHLFAATSFSPGMHSITINLHTPDSSNLSVSQNFFIQTPRVRLLEDLNPFRQTQGWGTPQKGKSVENNTLQIGGKRYHFGIGAHAPSSMAFRLDGQYDSLFATIGLDDESACGDGAIWIVRADQKIIFQSETLASTMSQEIRIPVSQVQVLELETKEGPTTLCDHTDWGLAWLSQND